MSWDHTVIIIIEIGIGKRLMKDSLEKCGGVGIMTRCVGGAQRKLQNNAVLQRVASSYTHCCTVWCMTPSLYSAVYDALVVQCTFVMANVEGGGLCSIFISTSLQKSETGLFKQMI